MSYNGSGTFNINTAGQPVVTGTVISSTAFNALTADLGTGLSTAITKNGQTTVTANIPFNGYKLTGIAVATASGDALSYGQAATVSALTDSALTSGRVPYASTAGLFVDSANLTFNGTTLTAAGFSGPISGVVTSTSITDSGLTSGRVTYAGTGGLLQDSANLTFNGTTLTANTIGAFTLGGTVAGGGNQLNNVIIGTTTPLAGAFTTVSASGIITSTATAGQVVKAESGTTGILYSNFANTGGTFLYGIDNSAGTALFSGSSAYAGFIGTTTATSLVLATNSVARGVFSSTGLAVTGTLSATGSITSTLASGEVLGNSTATTGTAYINFHNTSGQMLLGVDNSAGTGLLTSGAIAYATVLTTATVSPIIFGIAQAGKMTLDASGNLGIGTTSPSNKLHVYNTVNSNSVSTQVNFQDGGTTGGLLYQHRINVQGKSGAASLQMGTTDSSTSHFGGQACAFFAADTLPMYLYQGSNQPMLFATNGTERARIDSSGNLLMGTTTNTYSSRVVLYHASNTLLHTQTGSTGTSNQIIFLNPNGIVGSITTNGSATLYNVTSDHRLKENIVDAPDFGSLIDSIQVRSFDWKVDGSHQRAGFVAQELVTVAPEAVHQPTDTEEMMAVDYSKLVPMLVKEIQSLRARVAQLETKGI